MSSTAGNPDPIENAGLRRSIGVADLVLFNLAAVVGLRGFSGVAPIGPSALPLFASCVLLFFLPLALLVSGLGRRFPQEGGFYVWIREAFGPWPAFLSAWLYSVATLLFLPMLLMFIVSVGPHILGRRFVYLSDSVWFVLPVSLLILWTVTAANIAGIGVAKWISNFGGLTTSLCFLILVVSALFTALHSGSASQFSATPKWTLATFNTWSQMIYLLGGLELAGIMAGEIRDPRRTIPRAAALSSVGAAVFYLSGIAAILVILPGQQINPLYGLAQAAERAGAVLNLHWLPVVLAGMVVLGNAGQFGAILTSGSRLPYIFGIDDYLPRAFGRLHPRWGTPHISLLSGAVISTLFLLLMATGETLRGGFAILYDASILANAVPFCFLFAAGWKFGHRIAGGLGFLMSLTSLLFCLVPGSDITSVWSFELKVLGGFAVMTAIARVLFVRGERRRRALSPERADDECQQQAACRQ
ncbi:MAG: APC family permease [Acidobacteria bacterium]|nr:APC family permease [Acidobacteriota bacterium]